MGRENEETKTCGRVINDRPVYSKVARNAGSGDLFHGFRTPY